MKLPISPAVQDILDQAAATGARPTTKALREVYPIPDRHEVEKLAVKVGGITAGGQPDLAAKYLAEYLERYQHDADQAASIADAIHSGDLGAGHSSDKGSQPTVDHPTPKVLKEVASGRTAPTVDQLENLGFPTDIAEATHQAALIVAASYASGHLYDPRELAHELGVRIAHELGWPQPDDDWSSFAPVMPGADLSMYDAIADQIANSP